ncbi:MAG TPA: response regulator, partial [Desulfosarcina sp.]|nr:response regulator [Desulfosarcina sp.]
VRWGPDPSTAGRRGARKRAPDAPPAGAVNVGQNLTPGAEAARVMVVDDDPQVLKLVAQMVSRLGYRCTAAVDALDALFQLNQTPHELVITDVDMPFMDGFQLAAQIKRNHCLTKVILMTGQSEAAVRERMAGSTTVDGLLFKPFNLQVMREKIAAVGGDRFRETGPPRPHPCGA